MGERRTSELYWLVWIWFSGIWDEILSDDVKVNVLGESITNVRMCRSLVRCDVRAFGKAHPDKVNLNHLSFISSSLLSYFFFRFLNFEVK